MNRRVAVFAILLPIFIGAWHPEAPGASSQRSSDTPALAARRLWVHTIQPNADSAPAYLSHVRLRDGRRHAMVYVVAGNNTSNCSPGDPVRRATLYALDAASGRAVWTRSTTGPSRCTTAGPVTDPSGKWVYAPGLDGKLHRYDAASGTEATNHGWPHTITLMPDVEKMAAPATVGTGHLYVTTSGFIGDQGHYEGHLVTIDLASGSSQVFNTLCSNVHALLSPNPGRSTYCSAIQSGVWGRGEGAIDPVTHDVYIVSGNGPWNGRTNWGDSILKLDPAGSHLLDAYTPTTQADLNNSDTDLGSTGPAMLPTVTQNGRAYHLLVQGGKDGVLRLLNRDNLSGAGGLGHLGGDLHDASTPCGQEVLTAPAVWKSPARQIWVFYANDCGVAGYRLSSPSTGKFRLDQMWLVKGGGTTPIISHGILYVAHSGEVDGYNPTSHAVVWRAGGTGDVHWEYPLVAGNRLFMPDESGHVSAFALR
jgi:hypothetical protein